MRNSLLNYVWRPLFGPPDVATYNAIGRKLMLCIALALFPATSRAGDITLQGNFIADDNIQLFNVSVATAGDVDIRSYGYAGGTTSSGTVVSAGGFDTILTLFTASGAFIDDNDTGTGVLADPATGFAGDARLIENLAAGNYIVALRNTTTSQSVTSLTVLPRRATPTSAASPTFTSGAPCPGNLFRDISGTPQAAAVATGRLIFKM